MDRPIVRLNEMNAGMNVGLNSTDIQSIDSIVVDEQYNRVIKTYIPHIDALFGELVPGTVIGIGAEPGTGKTTFFMQMASVLAKGKPRDVPSEEGVNPAPQKVCFISGEQNLNVIKKTADRINASGFDVMNETSLERVLENIVNYDVVVIDSMNCLSSPTVKGSLLTLVNNANKIKATADKAGTIVFMICHSTDKGTIYGGNKVEHPIDCVFLIHHHKDNVRLLKTTKNRNGAIGSVYLNMTGTGFDLHNEVNPDTCLTVKDTYIHHMVDVMTQEAAISIEDLYELCDVHNLCVKTAQDILQQLVNEDKVVQDEDLWVVNL